MGIVSSLLSIVLSYSCNHCSPVSSIFHECTFFYLFDWEESSFRYFCSQESDTISTRQGHQSCCCKSREWMSVKLVNGIVGIKTWFLLRQVPLLAFIVIHYSIYGTPVCLFSTFVSKGQGPSTSLLSVVQSSFYLVLQIRQEVYQYFRTLKLEM